MSTVPNPGFRIRVDVTNPGQFFACCGLLELVERIAPGAESCFEGSHLCVSSSVSLRSVLDALHSIKLANGETRDFPEGDNSDTESKSENDEAGSGDAPIEISAPVSLRLDWWKEKGLKTWAGSMQPRAIFLAMCGAVDPDAVDPLNQRTVVYDPVLEQTGIGSRKKKRDKREPFYFDARRSPSSSDLDIGFSTNRLKMETLAYPAVEALCFIGLQRWRPSIAGKKLTYHVWHRQLPAILSAAACSGGFPDVTVPFEFLMHYRTKYMKAFLSAKPKKLQPIIK